MGAYHVVRLLKNRIYPTYQLHAYMANKKTAPQDGLRLAALLSMEWLRLRMGENAPEEIRTAAEPSRYLEIKNEQLPSLHLNSGYVIDIVSLPEQGTWTMQITEPDLGSEPGNPAQQRTAVPGRVIETNIAYQIVGTQLECGFQTVISDPEGTETPAEVYRTAVVRQLAEHPAFGLRQLTELSDKVTEISTTEQLKTLQSIWKSEDNDLPCVIFSEAKSAKQPDFQEMMKASMTAPYRMQGLRIPQGVAQKEENEDERKAAQEFAHHMLGFCRTYYLSKKLCERFGEMVKNEWKPGEIAILEARSQGGKCRVLSVRGKDKEQQLREVLYHYPRDRKVSFGHIAFLSAARESLLHSTLDAIEQANETEKVWAQKLTLLENSWASEINRREREKEQLSEQLRRAQQYQTQLEEEKEKLREENKLAARKHQEELAEKDERIAFLERKLKQPREHEKIADWANETFSGRLLMTARAKELLANKSARTVDMGLICDALDFLATDYWDRRFCGLTTEEMNTRCSQKYARPFEVKPIGAMTINFTPEEYQIKYFTDAQGHLMDSSLDYHLCVGNDPENLLRIYFLHDDAKKLIVVGSLPKHLRAVKIK